jgi:hypothetical protein
MTTPPKPQPPAPALPTGSATTNAAPTQAAAATSEIALGKRTEFFGKVTKAVKKAGGDCDKLGAALETLYAEAREMAKLRFEISGDHVAQDKANMNTAFKTVMLSTTTATCPDPTKIDRLLSILTDSE